MISVVALTLRWVLSLGKKFARVVPIQTTVIVALTLISQMSTLLASFLPLKVVILLGSHRTPHYFPDSWASLDRDVLIGALCLATLVFFVIHLIAERLVRTVTVLGAQCLLQRSYKLTLFENQKELAESAYQRFSHALAGGVFVTIVLVGLAVFYPLMLGVQLGYILLAFLCLWGLYSLSGRIRLRMEMNLSGVLGPVAVLGFLASFVCLVINFIVGTPPGVIVGIVSLLLSRQVMQRLSGVIGDLAALQRQRIKLDALFFHGKVLQVDVPNGRQVFWTLLGKRERVEWVSSVLREFNLWQGVGVDIRWYQLTQPNTAGLLVNTNNGRYFIKLFDTNRSAFALHEATLLAERLSSLPSLPLLGATQVRGLHCLLFEWKPVVPVTARSEIKKYLPLLFTAMFSVRISAEFQGRFQRSRPTLWQRLQRSTLERLQLAVRGVEEQQNLDRFLEALPSLIVQLKTLPLGICTPDVKPLNLTDDGVPILLKWSRWSLEPIGAGWPILRIAELEEVLLRAADVRPELTHVSFCQASLAALAFALEFDCKRQRYSEALILLPDLLNCLDKVKEKQVA